MKLLSFEYHERVFESDRWVLGYAKFSYRDWPWSKPIDGIAFYDATVGWRDESGAALCGALDLALRGAKQIHEIDAWRAASKKRFEVLCREVSQEVAGSSPAQASTVAGCRGPETRERGMVPSAIQEEPEEPATIPPFAGHTGGKADGQSPGRK